MYDNPTRSYMIEAPRPGFTYLCCEGRPRGLDRCLSPLIFLGRKEYGNSGVGRDIGRAVDTARKAWKLSQAPRVWLQI